MNILLNTYQECHAGLWNWTFDFSTQLPGCIPFSWHAIKSWKFSAMTSCIGEWIPDKEKQQPLTCMLSSCTMYMYIVSENHWQSACTKSVNLSNSKQRQQMKMI